MRIIIVETFHFINTNKKNPQRGETTKNGMKTSITENSPGSSLLYAARLGAVQGRIEETYT